MSKKTEGRLERKFSKDIKRKRKMKKKKNWKIYYRKKYNNKSGMDRENK